MKKNQELREEAEKMNRAEFLFAVGGATAGIAGWVVFPAFCSDEIEIEPDGTTSNPQLAPGVSFQRTDDGVELVRPAEGGARVVVGHLNEHGSKVVASMNGQRSTQDLAQMIHGGFDPAILDETETAVAMFLVTLAQAGLLAEPFYVNVHAVEVVG